MNIVRYKPLTEEQATLINRVERMEREVEELMGDIEERFPDPIWVNEARIEVKKGLMCLMRVLTRQA